MRLTLVISSLGRGGAERVLSILAGAWTEQGHQVTLLTFDHDEPPAYPLHPSVVLRNLNLTGYSKNLVEGLSRNVTRVRVLRRAIRESRPAIVISFLDMVNVLTVLATRGMNVPVIVSERIDPSLYDIGRVWNFLRRSVYPFADALVCQTASALARFQTMTRIRGFTIPNPVLPPPGIASRPEDQPSTCGHVLIAMGRLVPQKGFDLLLKAFARLAPKHPDWNLTILGAGPMLEALKQQSKSLALDSRVHFAGAVADPFPVLRSADLFVFSSRFEGFGMALAEAMACGLPVVSFDCPEGPAVIIRHGVDGLLVPPEDLSALTAALDRLMGDPQERRRLAVRAPEVLERFSPARILGLWTDLFERVAPGSTNEAKDKAVVR
jgi:GalNAc-alpha-(1->4)-GalNAc-alpha-(1->3)-diNAcBac-PP-undecaprenol alpha-1,4-N-acetyl-D-galactosaminyltransferase